VGELDHVVSVGPSIAFSAKRYTADHESIAFDRSTGVGTVSITDHAQSSLGDVVFVELPSVGLKVGKGGALIS
jgi:glycine cleavage system H lipoate-binding protein